ncbi:RNA polymerase sigma factor [Candidatus Poribacteria bacterium]|nr:RNA polymerase sigma factor [Candidatus Poribacteria bacterium]
MTEDEILIAQFKDGDQNAFSTLMTKYKSLLFSYVRRKVGDNDDAEDITQEVFVKVYRALPNWQPRASFQTWLYTIARNRCTDYHRARTRRQFQSLDDDEEFTLTPPATDIYSDPEKMAEESELGRIISEAIEQLSPKQKEVFRLHHYQGLQIKEIAETLGMADGSVKVHHHRAMKKLKKILAPLRDKGEI